MFTPEQPSRLWPPELARRLDAVCDRFEAEWKVALDGGPCPRVEDFLAMALPEDRHHLLPELLSLEREFIGRRGKVVADREQSSVNSNATTDLRQQSDASSQTTDSNPGWTVGDNEPLLYVEGYRLQEEIGRGGMGVVYRAYDQQFGREVAIKLLLESGSSWSRAERFRHEARITAQLQHPGIPPVHDLGTTPDGNAYLAMKLIRGQTLAELLRQRADQADDLPHWIQIFEQIAQTVGYAHAQGVIHRDLKPHNVMVGAFGEVQVMDWGLARNLQRSAQSCLEDTSDSETDCSESLTRAGAVLGTPAYMAPEQARGELDRLDARSDVFGLGAILCEILTGKGPYRGGSVQEILSQAARGEVAEAMAVLAATSTDRDLAELARRCLATVQVERPANGTEVAQAVAAYRAKVESRLRQAEVAQAEAMARLDADRRRRRVQRALLLALLGIAGLVGGGFLYSRQQQLERRAEAERLETQRLLREAALAREIEGDLGKGASFLAAKHLTDARLALERVRTRLHEGGPVELHQQEASLRLELEQLSKDDDMLHRLEEARLTSLSPADEVADARRTDRLLGEAFSSYGISPVALESEEGNRRIQASRIRDQCVSGLATWVFVKVELKQIEQSQKLMRAIIQADKDPWRRELYRLLRAKNWDAITDLAEREETWRRPPETLLLFYSLLRQCNRSDVEMRFLRGAQQQHPGDYWLSFSLAYACSRARPRLLEDEVRFFTAAVAARPSSAAALHRLGNALRLHGKPNEAIAAFRRAIQLRPDFTLAHSHLGLTLNEKGDVTGAVAAYRQALDTDPKYAIGHNNLGNALLLQRKLPEAVALFRRAIELEPTYALAHTNLGLALRRQGKLSEALVALRRAQELNDRTPAGQGGLAEQIKRTERFLELEQRLPAILAGKSRPERPEELTELAVVCTNTGRPGMGVRFFKEAFAAQKDLLLRHRHDAVRAAVLAAAGDGEDRDKIGKEESTRLREQARSWLKSGLISATRSLESNKASSSTAARRRLQGWLSEPDFATVRDKEELARLPASERDSWHKLWADVAAALASSQ